MKHYKETLHEFGIAVTEPGKQPELSCYQMLRLYLAAKQRGGSVTLPIGEKNEGEAEAFAAFLTQCREALEDVTPGLPDGFYAGNSTLSRDKTALYLFEFSLPRSALMVKGIKNKIISVSVLQSGSGVNQDSSLGLGSPGTLWLKLSEEDVQPVCTVLKLCLKGELDLYRETGAPITQN